LTGAAGGVWGFATADRSANSFTIVQPLPRSIFSSSLGCLYPMCFFIPPVPELHLMSAPHIWNQVGSDDGVDGGRETERKNYHVYMRRDMTRKEK